MISKREVFDTLNRNKDDLDRFDVERIGLFGSVSREEHDNDSDLDFIVEFKEGKKSYKNYIGLKKFLEEIFDKDIDLVTRNSLKSSMKERVLGETEYAKEA